MALSILSPIDPGNGTCGYCGPPGERSWESNNYHTAECTSSQLSCQTYQGMIDRGWRRSGTYLYKPDLKRSCCPQYTIRLGGVEFKASKSQRKLVNRFNRYVLHGDNRDGDEPHHRGPEQTEIIRRQSPDPPFDLETAIHRSEVWSVGEQQGTHKFEVTLEPSSYTQEKFSLYQLYQTEIHKEERGQSPYSFKRFLVESPLIREDIAYPQSPPLHLPSQYGSYHQLYRLDGKLIAMGVIDILPACVSSVYFMYDKAWERFSLGKISALREISLVKEIHAAGVPSLRFLYMGFYVHSCIKMKYKGDFSPSYLADPEEYTWHSLERIRPLLDTHHYATFAHPGQSLATRFTGRQHNPSVPWSDLQDIKTLLHTKNGYRLGSVASHSGMRQESTKRAVMTLVDALAFELAKAPDVVLSF